MSQWNFTYKLINGFNSDPLIGLALPMRKYTLCKPFHNDISMVQPGKVMYNTDIVMFLRCGFQPDSQPYCSLLVIRKVTNEMLSLKNSSFFTTDYTQTLYAVCCRQHDYSYLIWNRGPVLSNWLDVENVEQYMLVVCLIVDADNFDVNAFSAQYFMVKVHLHAYVMSFTKW